MHTKTAVCCGLVLLVAAMIAAGLDGIERKLDPGDAVNVDPETLTPAQREAIGARRLPQSLTEALDARHGIFIVFSALPK